MRLPGRIGPHALLITTAAGAYVPADFPAPLSDDALLAGAA
ncbi:hypothetical protein AB0J13_29170 [Streptomyces anulatus]